MNWDDVPGMKGPPGPRPPSYVEAHFDTFVVYRPVDACMFCLRAVSEEGFAAPEGEYICPHVRKAALEDLMMKIERSEVELKFAAQTTTLKNGVVQVTLGWAVPTRTAAQPGPEASQKNEHALPKRL